MLCSYNEGKKFLVAPPPLITSLTLFPVLLPGLAYLVFSFQQEYGDSVDIDGFDIDYANEVLTLKLGSLGTYVINKQTPNRQIWMSSPVSGPSRFDWDQTVQAWIYRRTKANLHDVLQRELEQLCGHPISLC